MRDGLLAALPRPDATAPLLLVEIDRADLAEFGPWPWPRSRLAEMVARIAAAEPASLAIDLLLEGEDRNSPAVLAARLREALGGQAAPLRDLPPGLPDHDALLAAALSQLPAVLGFALAPEAGPPPPVRQGWAVLGDAAAAGALSAPGAALPLPLLSDAAEGIAALSLTGTPVRAVPLMVMVGEEARSGLALEALRLALGAPTPVLQAGDGRIQLGDALLETGGAMLRLHPAATPPRRVTARALLAGEVPAAEIAGRIVLLGGAAPELGGLRATPFAALVPSVWLHAMAVEQLVQGWLPRVPGWARPAEAGAALLLGIGAAAAAALLGPVAAAAAVLLLAALPFGTAGAALIQAQLLLDPVPATLAVLAGGGVAGIGAFAALRLARARLAARFAQHLAPEVVARIAAEPRLLRIGGERRSMSFVFTDIEGFTALVERMAPEAMVALLDAYLSEAGEIAVAHGGVIDKVVGDALHIMFGAPLDQPDHAPRALRCGIALAAFGRRFAARPEAAAQGFGRTRVGVSTGDAVVGDVGGGRKLDYTAHGTAVNLAARLEAANKQFGTTLLADAATVQASPDVPMRRIGDVALRGLARPIEVFTPEEAPATATEA